MKYRAEIDGLRPVAVLPVLLFPPVMIFVAGLGLSWPGPRVEPHVSMETMLGIACSQAAAAAGPGYISENRAVDFDSAAELHTCERLYWSDGDHWSPESGKRVGARIVDPIRHRLEQELANG